MLQCYQQLGVNVEIVMAYPSSLSLLLSIIAKPGAKKERIEKGPGGELIVAVHQRPQDGEANEAIIRFLAKKLGISASSIILVRGHKGKSKALQVTYNFTGHKGMDYYQQKLQELFTS